MARAVRWAGRGGSRPDARRARRRHRRRDPSPKRAAREATEERIARTGRSSRTSAAPGRASPLSAVDWRGAGPGRRCSERPRRPCRRPCGPRAVRGPGEVASGKTGSITGFMPPPSCRATARCCAGAAEGPEDAVLLLEQLHQVHGRGDARGRPAGHEAPAPLEARQRAVPGLGAHMLEDHVDALALRQPADLALEAVRSVVHHVIGAERLAFSPFSSSPTVV